MRLTSRLQKLEARRRRGEYLYLWQDETDPNVYHGAGDSRYTGADLRTLAPNVQAIIFTWRGASDIPGAQIVRLEDDPATNEPATMPSATPSGEKMTDPTPYEPPYMGRGVATSHPRPRFRAR